ncbi:hypothetical protein ACIO13_28615 [Streptomyces sp. NPDC087425]|uniref:hypothetical protein n=1 Tax=unclassified Streptomyces TaxID=2593676 RepID=UPI0038011992
MNARESDLPAPEPGSPVDPPDGERTPTDAPWYEAYGGTLDPESGVISFPPNSLPPCPFDCPTCADTTA